MTQTKKLELASNRLEVLAEGKEIFRVPVKAGETSFIGRFL